jgi:hypothetical protein
MKFVILTKTEWALLCSQGCIDILSERFASFDTALATPLDNAAWSLFSRAPRYVLGDANGMVVAQIDEEWASLREIPITRLLRLSVVGSFFALTGTAQRHLAEDANRRNVRLSEPIFGAQWRAWTDEQRRILRVRGAKELVRLIGLDGALDWGDDSGPLGEIYQNELGVHDSLASRLLLDARKVVSDDRARATEGTCAHAVVSATLWASHICGREIPAEGTEFATTIGTLYDQLVNFRYGDVDHISMSLHRSFERLRSEAPEAFGSYVSPLSVGLFFRYQIASRFGPLPQPEDVLSTILRLRVLDGDSVAAACCYLVGLELTSEFIQQIALHLAPSPTSVAFTAGRDLGLGVTMLDTMLAIAAAVPDQVVLPPAQEELHSTPDPITETPSDLGSSTDCSASGTVDEIRQSHPERSID